MNFSLQKTEEINQNKRPLETTHLQTLESLDEEGLKKATVIQCPEDTWQVSKRKKKTEEEIAQNLLKNITSGSKPSFLEQESEILKKGVKEAAEDQEKPNFETEGYGKALLRGMGWQEGKPYGRSSKVIEPLMLKATPKLSGLGSQPKLNAENQSREEVPNSLEKYLMKKNITEFIPNCMITVISGAYEGLFGRVLSIFNDKLQTRLNDLRTVRVNIEDAKLLNISNLNEEHPARKFARQETLEEKKVEQKVENKQPIIKEKKSKIEWLRPFLKVRIISKSLKNGKYYKKKAIVIDVPDIFQCTVKLIDDDQIIEDVFETMLETVIPSKGENVMVVKGKFRGLIGTLIEKSNSKEVCVVQFHEDDAIQKIHYDDVCMITRETY
eukprot:gene3178-5494_t